MRAAWLVVAGCALPPRPDTPVVQPLAAPECQRPPSATRVVAVDPMTWSAALASAQPGDRLELASGDYPGAEILTDDIVITGDARITSAITLHDRHGVQLRGLRFDSPDAQAWLLADGDIQDLTLGGNSFDSHAANTDDGAFVGVGLTGKRITLCGNAFGSWLGDEVSADRVDGLLIENNDWSQASAEHALLAIVGHHVVIRGNAFRNPWQRALHITDRSDDDRTDDVLVDRNTFIDSDWKPGTPNPSNDDQFRGGNEVVRFLGARGIFRNNLLIGSHQGDGWDCHGILNFQTFISSAGIDTRRFTQFRVYNNTFDHNATSAIIFYVGEPGLALDDNRFQNNVIAASQHYAFTTCSSGNVPWTSYRFTNSVAPGDAIHLDDQKMSVAQAPAPEFADNTDAEPTYVDGTFGARVAADFTTYTLADMHDAFTAYRLAPESAGVGTAGPLAHVTAASASTVVALDDVLPFSDGFTMTAGDRISIGAQLATVIARDVDGKTLTLDTALTVTSGDPVTIVGASPDPGAH